MFLYVVARDRMHDLFLLVRITFRIKSRGRNFPIYSRSSLTGLSSRFLSWQQFSSIILWLAWMAAFVVTPGKIAFAPPL
jgi:hypothetical protein